MKFGVLACSKLGLSQKIGDGRDVMIVVLRYEIQRVYQSHIFLKTRMNGTQ
jgi:hypothetical protein